MPKMFSYLLILLEYLGLYHTTDPHTIGINKQYIIDDPLCKHRSVDQSMHSEPVKMHSRITDLLHGEHFDDMLRDTPDNMRPPSIILFYNSSNNECMKKYTSINYETNIINNLPSRGFLFAAQYDIYSAPRRLWYKFIPERDLVKRFNVKKCNDIVYVPRMCNGFTKWCINNTIGDVQYLGCDGFVEQCKGFKTFDEGNEEGLDWIEWVHKMIESESIPEIGGPNPGKKFDNYEQQENWIKGRDGVTTGTQLRNAYSAAALPAFTEKGYKSIEIPDIVMREFLIFYNNHLHEKRDENWQSYGQTQINGHEVSPYLIYMDLDMHFRDEMARRYIKPELEKWIGFPLELTSHYGLREYHSGAWLRNHIDRIDVLVISVTFSIMHIRMNETNKQIDLNNWKNEINTWPNDVDWPLEAVDFNGNNVRYPHKPGTALLYESAKLPHGRPFPLPKNHDGSELVHIGSFCHFVPADGSWNSLGHSQNAARNLERNKKYVRGGGRIEFRTPRHFKSEL